MPINLAFCDLGKAQLNKATFNAAIHPEPFNIIKPVNLDNSTLKNYGVSLGRRLTNNAAKGIKRQYYKNYFHNYNQREALIDLGFANLNSAAL
jgi:hypothetical protein